MTKHTGYPSIDKTHLKGMKLFERRPFIPRLKKAIHPIVLKLMQLQHSITIVRLNGDISMPSPAIYTFNHSTRYDAPIACELVGEHACLLVGKQKLEILDRIGFELNGVIWVDRCGKERRRNVKREMTKVLQEGTPIIMYPEGTWNLEPSKPSLPLYWGVIDVARETGVQIVPIALEYQSDKCYVIRGSPITVSEENSNKTKLYELEESFATLKWTIWESLLQEKRRNLQPDDWEQEMAKRLQAYRKFDFERERAFVRRS